MGSRAEEQPSIQLTTQPAGRWERRLAIGVALATIAAFFALAPFASLRVARVSSFLPIYQSALITCEIVTAIFLYGRFSSAGVRSLLVLASGYLFSATMAVFHLLTFPELFAPVGLLGAGEQTTAWIYFLWHLGFPGAVIAYALMSDAPAPGYATPQGATTSWIVAAAIGTIAFATVLVLVTTVGHGALPQIMSGNEDRPAKYVIAWGTWLVTLAALPLLWRRGRHSVLDLWLMAVIAAWLCDVAQAAVFNSGRFSLGWYAGRVYGLLAATFLLAVLILEDSKLYGRLMRSYAEERRQRRLVEQRNEQVDGLNRSLERRVAARTEELERLNAELRRSRAELHELAALGATAREQERARLARELHDEINQGLIVLGNEIDRVRQGCESEATVASTIARMQELIDGTLQAAKRIETNLRPAALDMLGLAGGAEWLAEQLREREGLACELLVEPAELSLPEPHSTAVFRILQEALANVARHARASRVEVSLRCRDGSVRLRISDDGAGFDPQARRKDGSYGLMGMRERVHLSSGWIVIDSAPGRGTRIDVSIPLDTAP